MSEQLAAIKGRHKAAIGPPEIPPTTADGVRRFNRDGIRAATELIEGDVPVLLAEVERLQDALGAWEPCANCQHVAGFGRDGDERRRLIPEAAAMLT